MEMTTAEMLKNMISSQTWGKKKKKSVWETIMLLSRFTYLFIFPLRNVINQENLI